MKERDARELKIHSHAAAAREYCCRRWHADFRRIRRFSSPKYVIRYFLQLPPVYYSFLMLSSTHDWSSAITSFFSGHCIWYWIAIALDTPKAGLKALSRGWIIHRADAEDRPLIRHASWRMVLLADRCRIYWFHWILVTPIRDTPSATQLTTD